MRIGELPHGAGFLATPNGQSLLVRAVNALIGRTGGINGLALPHPQYTVATVPDVVAYAGSTVFVTDEAGGPTLAYSDGTNWKRVYDNAAIS